MSALIPSGNATGTGTMTLLAPPTNGTQTVTIPDTTGTMMVSGNMPAFYATASANQTIASSTLTKIQFNTKQFDTNTNFDATTNYRFTPTVAGYYQISAGIQYAGTSSVTAFTQCQFYKNGSSLSQGALITAIQYAIPITSMLVYFNGSTDYIEVYAQQSQGISQIVSGQFFTGAMVRAA